MELLYWLSNIRTDGMDRFFLKVTAFGDDTLVVVVFLITFWCISKRAGYLLFYNLLFGAGINQIIKVYMAIPRPWILDPSFHPVPQAILTAGGYSFPSGHTAMAVALYGNIAKLVGKWWLKILAILMVILIAFSRMYLGVHTPYDVGASIIIGVILMNVIAILEEKAGESETSFWKVQSIVLVAMVLGFILMYAKTRGMLGKEQMRHGLDNYCKLFGMGVAMIFSFWYDHFKRPFETKAVWWAQIIKVAMGLLLILAIKTRLQEIILSFITISEVAYFINYFILCLFGGLVYPLTFRIWRTEA